MMNKLALGRADIANGNCEDSETMEKRTGGGIRLLKNYKVIITNAARKYHIPFHYFQYASTEKCAQQVAEREQETL